MSDQKIRTELNSLPIQELIDSQRQSGRVNLDPDFKKFWKAKHDYAIELLEDERRGRHVRRLAELLRDITYSIHARETDPVLTYYPYTDVQIIDWFIGPTHVPFTVLKRRALDGIFCLLHDLLQFEANSLGGFDVRHHEKLSKEVLHERIDKIERAVLACVALFAQVVGSRPSRPPELIHYDTLEQYVGERSGRSALIHFSCFPQSKYHDEVVFLRTIHIAELCFFGLRTIIIETIENLRRQCFPAATKCLNEATGFAELLHRTFGVLRTMPPDHFADFRDYTENASAIQSRGYQLLDVYFRGVDQHKLRVYKERRHLAFLEKYAHPSFVHLRSLLREDGTSRSEDWQKVMTAAQQLDAKLKTWRGLHVGFALAYLPPAVSGTGGTVGAPYLKQFLHEGLFSETAIDEEILKEMFPDIPELPGECRVPSDQGVAPVEELRYPGESQQPTPLA